MTRNMMPLAIAAMTLLGGCNPSGGTSGQPDSVVIKGVTYTKAGGAAQAVPSGGGAAPTMPAAPKSAPAAGTIPAVGRWTAISHTLGGNDTCGELGDVEFTPTGFTVFGPNGQSESHPVTFANITPTSFTIYEGPRPLVNVEMTGPNSLTMTNVGGTSHETCVMTRH